MLTPSKMKAIVDNVVTMGNEFRQLSELEDRAKPNQPADAKAVDALQRRLKIDLPPSYRQLLSIYDGVDNFDWVDVSVLSTSYLTKNPDLDRTWIDAGVFKAEEIFTFAMANTDAHVLVFRLQTADSAGEMAVTDLDANGILAEHANLEAYLVARERWFSENLAQAKADHRT